MERSVIVSQIINEKLVAIVRTQYAFDALKLAEVLFANGISIMEITLNTPGVLSYIGDIRNKVPSGMLIGVGSVTDKEGAKKVIDAGAQFIVTPATPDQLISYAHEFDVPVLAGAFTPLEILTAHQQGADLVKLFPAEHAGPAYLKAIKAPLDYIPIMPTGGVNPNNIAEWLNAGACAFGLGTALVNDIDIKNQDWKGLGKKASNFRLEIKKYQN